MASTLKLSGSIVEYLDQGRFRSGLVVRDQERHLAIVDESGRERLISHDLVMMTHPERRVAREQAASAFAALEAERASLAAELDLNLLWEIAQEQARTFSAGELADLFFGRSSKVGTSVMLEALLNDRLFFTRRHLEFVPRPRAQVERLRVQEERIKGRSEGARRMQATIRDLINGEAPTPSSENAKLTEDLSLYLKNPFTRSREVTQLLTNAVPDIDTAELAYEVLERLDAKPAIPRFACIAGLRPRFSDAAIAEAMAVISPGRPPIQAGSPITIDDEDTVEIDDALSCEELPNGALHVWVHIAMVSDLVAMAGAIDAEAASRATTVYLPEITVPMLPETISSDKASLVARQERPVLTTDAVISASGEIERVSIYPGLLQVEKRLDYAEADRLLEAGDGDAKLRRCLQLLNSVAARMRERRRTAGALLPHRREPKVTVRGDDIQIRVIDNESASRALVAEYMVLSNFVAARFAAENKIPIIFRVQPDTAGDGQRPRLSLYPEYHAGIGLDYYAQFSSPIRRYADLVLQRQLVTALAGKGTLPYSVDELLTVLAGAENAEANGRELERRAKRYWILRYLERKVGDGSVVAFALRDGATAELVDYGVRGTLRGAPNLPDQTPVLVRISRIDPLRGWLALDYIRVMDSGEPLSRSSGDR